MNVPGEPSTSQSPGDRSDRSLLIRVKEGNSEAATALYLRYAERLGALARAKSSQTLAKQVSAEEIVQSVFGSFFRGTQKGYYDLPAGDELWGLFLVIALNKIRAKGLYHQAAKRDARRTVGSDVLEGQADRLGSDDQAAMQTLELTIDESLQQFPDGYREVVELRVQGYEVAEIAEQTKRSKRTVERILQEVRKKLSTLMSES